MTEEPTSAPDTPPEAPQAPAPMPPPSAWEKAPPPTAPGIPGFVYADVPNRFIALIIDVILLGIINLVVTAIIGAILGPQYDVDIDSRLNVTVTTNFLSAGVTLIATLAIGAVYWIYTWTQMRGSPGLKVLGMQVGNFPDGASLTQNQAIRRWVALGGPLPLVQSLNQLPIVGGLIGVATLAYFAYLLYSTATSPTKQGFHDKFANSVVVKAARVA